MVRYREELGNAVHGAVQVLVQSFITHMARSKSLNLCEPLFTYLWIKMLSFFGFWKGRMSM